MAKRPKLSINQRAFAAEMIGFVDVPEFDERHGMFDVYAWPSGF